MAKSTFTSSVIGLILCVMVMANQSVGEVTENNRQVLLLPIQVDSQWGFIDQSGKVRIEPRFDLVSETDELADISNSRNNKIYLASIKDQLFLVDEGKVLKRIEFTATQPLKRIEYVGDSMFRVVSGQSTYAIVDTRGEFTLRDGEFDCPAGCFNEGLLPIRQKKRWGFAYRGGRIAIPPTYEWAGSFSNGLAPVMVVKSQPEYDQSRFGYVDQMGRLAIEPQFHFAGCFSNGFAPVILPLTPSTKIRRGSYITRSSELIVEPGSIRFVLPFKEGVVAVENAETKLWGYLNEKGKYAITPQFQWAKTFSDGRAAVAFPNKNENGAGYIDPSGKLVIELEVVERLGEFSNGLAYVEADGHQGYINTNGKWVWRHKKAN